jgi:uncharacterized membrane protein YqiK
MPSVTVSLSISYDLEELLKANNMEFDEEKIKTDKEYFEKVKDTIYNQAAEDLDANTGGLTIHDSDINELID